jgi:hypothetical protein
VGRAALFFGQEFIAHFVKGNIANGAGKLDGAFLFAMGRGFGGRDPEGICSLFSAPVFPLKDLVEP